MNKFPNFFVAGAAKCGTTALYHILEQHPEIYLSPIKEPNHFCTDIKPGEFSEEYQLHEKRKNLNLEKFLAGPMKEKHFDYFVTHAKQYELLFKNVKNEKAIGEMSNSYLFSEVAAQNIKLKIPDAKIIIMLRNPVERIFSHYLAHLRDGKTYLPFMQEIQKDFSKPVKGWWKSHCYFEMGLYYEQVKRYFDVFDHSQIKITWFEDFESNFQQTAKEIFIFLGVNPNIPVSSDEKYNEAREPKNKRFIYFISKTGIKKPLFGLIPESLKPKIKKSFFKRQVKIKFPEEERNYLKAFYKNDILLLQKLSSKDLSSWL